MAGKVRHLLERDGRHYARLGVPEGLRSIVGKRELLEPLGADRMRALRRLPAAVATMQATLEAARGEAQRGRVANPLPRAGKALTVPQIARAHYREQLATDTADRDSGVIDRGVGELRPAFAGSYLDALRRVAAGHADDSETNAAIGWAIDAFTARGNVTAPVGSLEWRQLARTLAGVQIEVVNRTLERDRGDETGAPSHPALVNKPDSEPKAPDATAARLISPDSVKPLSELVPLFAAERGANPAMNREYEVAARIFEEHMGEAVPAYKITRQDVHAFKRALGDTPANYTKRFPGMSLPEAIKANKARATPFPALNAKTVNDKWLSRLHSLLNWCVRSDILPDNPAAGIKVDSVKDKAKPPRVPFTPDDLSRIFAPPFFDPGKSLGEPQWAALISLFSGIRPSELAQVKLNSIRHERGVLVFAIEEDTKNIGSQRLVPVHSTLIDCGLETYVRSLRAKRETHLFPEWYRKGTEAKEAAAANPNAKMTLNQYFPRFIPKRFNDTLLPKLGIHDDRKVFYSFRHTFKTGLARAGVDKPTRDYLCGHNDVSAGAVYVHDVSIEAMKQAIEKLAFDGFTS